MGERVTPQEFHLLRDEIAALRRRTTALLVVVCVIIGWLASLSFGNDFEIALADRQTLPVSDWPYTYYFSMEAAPPQHRETLEQILCFAVCSLNDEVVIEHQLPVNVFGCWRIDTRGLGWETALPALIKQHYPYSSYQGELPLVVRADWFVQFALDQETGGDAYYRLIFGTPPKTLNDFLGLLQVETASPFEHGHIEDRSGVANSGTRLIATMPTRRRQDLWITYDSEELNKATDPLENLAAKGTFDANEIIGALPKSVASSGVIGHLQVYALANATGELQTKAPAAIVTDSTGTRGVEIRNAMSCIACHSEGLRPLKQNAFKEFVRSGAEAYSDYKTREKIERFHLTQLDKLLSRHNEDYAAILHAVNGLTPEANAKAFSEVIRQYDAPITMESAAAELGCTVRELTLAMGYAGALPARIAQLPHGGEVKRSTWEPEYRTVLAALSRWRNAR